MLAVLPAPDSMVPTYLKWFHTLNLTGGWEEKRIRQPIEFSRDIYFFVPRSPQQIQALGYSVCERKESRTPEAG